MQRHFRDIDGLEEYALSNFAARETWYQFENCRFKLSTSPQPTSRLLAWSQ
jgi:hypothetical protein